MQFIETIENPLSRGYIQELSAILQTNFEFHVMLSLKPYQRILSIHAGAPSLRNAIPKELPGFLHYVTMQYAKDR